MIVARFVAPLSGPTDWSISEWGAVGDMIAGGAAIVALILVWRGLAQLRDARNRFRAELAPYLRVDLSPDLNSFKGASWGPSRDPDTDLTYGDLSPSGEPSPSVLDGWRGSVPVFLWVENRQTAPQGVADSVRIEIEIEAPERENRRVADT